MIKKLLALYFALMCSASVLAQTKRSVAEDSVLCVVDGVKHRGTPQIDTGKIAEISVYKDKVEAYKKYGNDARNGVIIVTTLQFAVQSYQKRFSALSLAYRQYILKNKGNDDGVLYLINDKLVPVAKKQKAIKLYKTTNIKEVDFKIDHDSSRMYLKLPTLNITTN
jgi:hypothetical protein